MRCPARFSAHTHCLSLQDSLRGGGTSPVSQTPGEVWAVDSMRGARVPHPHPDSSCLGLPVSVALVPGPPVRVPPTPGGAGGDCWVLRRG